MSDRMANIQAWLNQVLNTTEYTLTPASEDALDFAGATPVSIFSGTMCLRFLYQSYRHLMAMLRDEPLGGEPEPKEQES